MVFGNLSTGYWLGAATAAGLHWQELGRTTLGSAGDSIDTTSLANKPYLMVLAQGIASGETTFRARFNSDTGSNYAHRVSASGGAETLASDTSMYVGQNSGGDTFTVFNVNNKSTKEKLVMSHSLENNAAGAGNVPARTESVAKWTNTSNAISAVNIINTQSGSFDSGSEVVVLGYDPDDTEGGSIWEELASVDLSGGASDTISSGTFTAKKYLMYELYAENDSGNIYPNIRVGNGTVDSGSNYARRNSGNGGSDGTNASDTYFGKTWYGETSPNYITGFIINKSDKEKLGFAHGISQGTAGAGNAPDRYEEVMKWANTSAQINIIDAVNTGSGDFGTNSSLKVWGFD